MTTSTSLPKLTGSAKQIAWAESLREAGVARLKIIAAGAITGLDDVSIHSKTWRLSDEERAARKVLVLDTLREMLARREASVWIGFVTANRRSYQQLFDQTLDAKLVLSAVGL